MMHDLDEQLHRMAATFAVPATSPQEDLERGRSRSRSRKLTRIGASAAATVLAASGVALLAEHHGRPGATYGFAGQSGAVSQARRHSDGVGQDPRCRRSMQYVKIVKYLKPVTVPRDCPVVSVADSERLMSALTDYRDILRADLDPTGSRIQTSPVTGIEYLGDVGRETLGTKLGWNRGGMLEIGVGHSLDALQFSCDGACVSRSVPRATKALVRTGPGRISVAVFQEDGDIVVLDADVSFGNDGTSTSFLDLTADQLLATAADPRIDLPDPFPHGALPFPFPVLG